MTFEPYFERIPPPGEEDLHPPLPKPPTILLGGIVNYLERVVINDLDTWRRKHGVQFVRDAWCGELGHVKVYGGREGQ